MLLWEMWTELYQIEESCGNCGQNNTGMRGVLGTEDRIIKD
jgi:hypothetical protein